MRKINYFKKWDSEGYRYTQTVNITEKELTKMKSAHLTEYIKNLKKKELCSKEIYLGTPNSPERKDSVIFTNHTQRDFYAKILSIKNLKNRNTCFIVN